MADKVINGSLDVTGAISQNGTALEPGTKLYQHKIKCKFGEHVEAYTVFISTNPTPITSSQLLNADFNTVFNPIITSGIAHHYKTDLCIPAPFELYFKQSGIDESTTFTLYVKNGDTEYAFTELSGADSVTPL